ncbi:ribonuclease HII [Candidatus Kaiserbacteria bacterium]|nr:MAG: ribonuclease HII [Candidatus Kaiserbacteria bacterium]
MKKRIVHIIGVDEAGRGPLAGPVAVGAVLVPVDFNWAHIPGVGDSKKVKAENREAIFRLAARLRKEEALNFATALIPASTIDKIGITHAVQKGIVKCLATLDASPKTTMILLDGLLHAPSEYIHQETIIKGDAKEKVIGLASICAKVTRDAHMVRVARKHPEYLFDIHKGYGTKKHIEAILTHGLSPIHRRSFTKRFQ